ncbi:MAG: acyl-CoA dehydrogenase [Acidobacteria bacterium]|nr:acyl-CoA dehydrogenase [Acidobacteriota bacterium]
MNQTQPFDFIGFDGLLSDDERLVRATVRRFVAERYAPQAAALFREGRFPVELVSEIADLGLFGARIEGYGCAGMSAVEYGLTMQELERGDSGLRSFVSVQGSLAMEAIHAFGSEEQRSRWLPEMAAGRAVGCFGLTEPNFGSNPSSMQTRARRSGDGFVLNGEKTWITNGSIARIAVVWAKLEDSDEVRGFLVEKGTPGFSTSDLHGKLSMRASITSSLSLTDCEIPAENALPSAVGLKAALGCLTQARLGIGWGCIGAAQDCYETARRYCLDRKQFGGKPIASHQLVQAELAWMATEISKAQLLAWRIGRLADEGRLHFSQVSLLKRNNAWMALEVARRARDLLGANGITEEYPVFRHMANLETVKTYEGTENIHTLAIGQRITGLAAFE